MPTRIKQFAQAIGLGRPAHAVWMALKARGYTSWRPLVPEDDFRACVKGVLAVLENGGRQAPFGHYLEFGVSRGTSLACVYQVLREADISDARLIGFDSFEGMPPGSDQEGWQEGDFRSSRSATRRYLVSKGVDMARVDLVKGWFSQTLTAETRKRFGLTHASLIMIDCDIYSASVEALDFCLPYIGKQAVIMFDDWGEAERMGKIGQKEAFAEFLNANPSLHATELTGYNASSRVFHIQRCRPVDSTQ